MVAQEPLPVMEVVRQSKDNGMVTKALVVLYFFHFWLKNVIVGSVFHFFFEPSPIRLSKVGSALN